MNFKFIKIMTTMTLLVLIFSIWQLNIAWNNLSSETSVIAFEDTDLSDLNNMLDKPITVEKSSQLDSIIKFKKEDWQSIVKDNFFSLVQQKDLIKNTAKEIEEPKESKETFPKTNLPNFLAKNNRNKMNITLRAISEQNDNSRVILTDNKSGKTYILRVGEKIKEYTVKEINKNMIIISYKEEEIKLPFNKDRGD